jgi:hypothetical protein
VNGHEPSDARDCNPCVRIVNRTFDLSSERVSEGIMNIVKLTQYTTSAGGRHVDRWLLALAMRHRRNGNLKLMRRALAVRDEYRVLRGAEIPGPRASAKQAQEVRP